ncbi:MULTISPECIES: hypothetical protein [unclassified Novosphingobium]|uniref:hypothetical protein n=1 Tax=unclassified Novosphingobium TaxID=2644732 RepID=UPI001358C887|nr:MULTISPECIES: hypothetical protein [unclassified Novosphingobium]
MSEILNKYAKFVDLLLEKTKKQKIDWDFDSSRRIISVWNGDVLLNIQKREDEDKFEDVYTLSLLNRSGDYLEVFSDEDLNKIETIFGDDNYYTKMASLYNLAMRQSTGADRALDDFIKAVEEDGLEFPF